MNATLSQKNRIASLETPLGADVFTLVRFQAYEGLSELFRVEVEALTESDTIDLSGLLGQKCTVKYKLRDGTERFFSGILSEGRWEGTQGRYFLYRLTLRPWLWLLSRRSDCKIYKDKTAPEIIKAVLGREQQKDFEDRLSENYQQLEYCVQYRETDLDFVQRLMEFHGIYYYFKHSAEGHKLVLSDSLGSHDMVQAPATPEAGKSAVAPGTYGFVPKGASDRRTADHFSGWNSERRLETGRVELAAFDFTKSTTDLLQSKADGPKIAKAYEVFDYPGKFTQAGDGQRFAEVRVQMAQASDGRRYAWGDAASIYPGSLCKVGGLQTEDGNYLTVRATHAVNAQAYETGQGGGDTYSGSYEFLKSDQRYRAPMITPKPVVHGPQTAIVVGENRKSGEEIDVDKNGCILVQFHWDRDAKTTSRRARVAQVWSGKGWGGQFIPRIGQEVVVEFLEGDPDEPLVVGTVYNDQHQLPYSLPDNKTQSGIKSDTSKNSGGFNEFAFEDKKGDEKVRVRAERDLSTLVQRAETREIGDRFWPGSGSPARKTTLKNGDDQLDIDQGSLLVEAKTSIKFKVGQSTVTIEPNSVTIDSPSIKLKSMKTDINADVAVAIKAAMITLN